MGLEIEKGKRIFFFIAKTRWSKEKIGVAGSSG